MPSSPELFGQFEQASLQQATKDIEAALSDLHDYFKSSISAVGNAYDNTSSSLDEGIARLTEIDGEAILSNLHTSAIEQTKRMLDGCIDSEGNQTLGLNEISTWRINPEYVKQNIKQQAGYAAEVISTAKENIIAKASGIELTTYRADDRPDLGFQKNDPYVDKVRVNAAGEVVERIQTKFVGRDGAEWVRKMMSKDFEKYLDGIHVDKLECPSDYFDKAKAYIADRRESLTRQLDHVTTDGKSEAVDSVQSQLSKLNRIDEMIEKSLVSTDDARYAREHPRRYAAKLFAPDIIKESVGEGASGAAFAAGLTFVSSAVMHGKEFFDGEINEEELVRQVGSEVGAAGVIGGATSFVSAAVANAMQTSSCNLIRNIGGSCLPASTIAFAVESYDSVVDYAQGAIGVDDLAYDLGHNATTIAGGAVGGAKIGAVAGTAFGPAGSAAGGIVGGLVGSAVASCAYETALEYAPEAAQEIASQVERCARGALECIERENADQLEIAKASFNEFFATNGIPVNL